MSDEGPLTFDDDQHHDDFVEKLLSSCDLDYSLPSPSFLLNDSLSSLDEGSFNSCPSTSTCNGEGPTISEALLGINEFLFSANETCSTNAEQSIQIEDLDNSKKKSSPIKNRSKIKKGQCYKPNFKRKVLNYAVQHTFRETADKYNINRNTLTEWAREYKRLLQLKKSTTKRPGSTLKTDVPIHLAKTENSQSVTEAPPGDVQFLQWLRHKRQAGERVRREEVQAAGEAILQASPNAPDWFTRWVGRLLERSAVAAKEAPKADKHIFYPTSFKLEVALYAKEYTKKAAASAFGVSSRRLYEWCDPEAGPPPMTEAKKNVEAQLLAWFNKRCAAGNRPKSRELIAEGKTLYAASGLPHVKCSQGWLEKIQKRLDLKFAHADDGALVLWVLAQLDDNKSLSVMDVTDKARQLAQDNQVTSFKGSKGWTLRFLKRHSHLLQSSSARLADLPAGAGAMARSFCMDVQQRVSAAGLANESMGCMDEVPITFVYPSDKVPTPRLLRKASLETSHVVVLLSATSNGLLLPPAVILKGERAMQIYQEENLSIPVLYHPQASVDAVTLTSWCEQIWFRYVQAPSLLVLDCYAPHRNEEWLETLSSGCCHAAIIPPGCALHLQPCSFNLSRRFQDMIQEEWLEYVAEGKCPEWRSKIGPEEERILQWVAKACLALRKDSFSITSSFQLTGLTASTSTSIGNQSQSINQSSSVYN